MFLRCLSFAALALASAVSIGKELRVCAEPDNLPFSHQDGSGFENRIADVLAREMGARLRFEWQPQRRAFVRKTLGEGLCDAWMGVPAEFERVLATRPYYRSTYVFVFPKSKPLLGFDSENLRALRIGVQLPGDDFAATPPGHALALKGAIENVVGYTVYGERPAVARIVDAVAKGALDAGVVWGPAAGFFAAKAALGVAQAKPPAELAGLPFQFSISVGVKRGQKALRDELDAALDRRRAEVDAILADYAVPTVR